MNKALALLARLPSDAHHIDWAMVLVCALACAAVAGGLLTPDQLPSAIDAAMALLGIAGVRAASLWSRARARAAAGEGAALAALVAKARAGQPVAAEALAHARALVDLAAETMPAAPLAIVREDKDGA